MNSVKWRIQVVKVEAKKAIPIEKVRGGWKKFRMLISLLILKGISLLMKGRLYASCVTNEALL